MKINKKDLNLLPNKIVGTYTDDYDIIYVHEIIIDTLSQEKKNLPEMYKELELLKKAESKIQTYNDKKETLAAIDILNKKIQMIVDDQKINSYKEIATPLVQKYMDYKLNGEYFDETSYELLAAAANQIGMTLENARLFEETKTLAITDGMTGLYNHRYFLERITEEFERTKRYKRSLSLIMIDVDHFKKYNDTHGHPKGDGILKGVAKILKDTVRKSDTAARYGGEEFVIILPETGGEEALLVAEKLRMEVETHDFPGGETQPLGRITISQGVASCKEELKSFDELIKNADNALYRAKEEGRNRVCT